MPTVLFVCSANMCRSPMAEALFNRFVQQTGNDDWFATSAGVWAIDGSNASSGAAKAMEKRGLDIRSHVARRTTGEIIKETDLILTMEKNHLDALQAAYPKYRYKIIVFSEMAGMHHDIRDPIGGLSADYDDTADELEYIITAGFKNLQKYIQDQKDDQV